MRLWILWTVRCANRGACRGQRRQQHAALPTARPSAHKPHSLQLNLIDAKPNPTNRVRVILIVDDYVMI